MTPISSAIVDRIVLLMISGAPAHDLRAACVSSLKLAESDVDAAIAEARKKITLAAQLHRDEQVGTAVTRLNDIYARCIREKDTKAALATQKELNKLMGLYREPDMLHRSDDGSSVDSAVVSRMAEELQAVRSHLLPLGLAPDDYPLREHARIVADLVRRKITESSDG